MQDVKDFQDVFCQFINDHVTPTFYYDTELSAVCYSTHSWCGVAFTLVNANFYIQLYNIQRDSIFFVYYQVIFVPVQVFFDILFFFLLMFQWSVLAFIFVSYFTLSRKRFRIILLLTVLILT